MHARKHTRSHPPTNLPPPHTHTHTFFFWLTNNLKHSINYNKTKFLKQQNTKIKTLNRPQHINYRQHLWSNMLNPTAPLQVFAHYGKWHWLHIIINMIMMAVCTWSQRMVSNSKAQNIILQLLPYKFLITTASNIGYMLIWWQYAREVKEWSLILKHKT